MTDRNRPLRRLNTSAKMKENRNGQKHDIHMVGELILIRLRKGDYFKVACGRAGVSVRTAEDWLRCGKSGLGSVVNRRLCREEHVWFYEEVTLALAEVEGSAVDAWMEEVNRGNWQAARDFLARRFPQRWANSEHRALKVRSTGDTEIQLVWDDDPQQAAPLEPGGFIPRLAHDEEDMEEEEGAFDDFDPFADFASEAGGGTAFDDEI